MVDRKQFDIERTDFEAALASLVPNKSSLDRDRLMYLAGQASAAHPITSNSARNRLWPATAAVMTLAACVLGVLLLIRSEPPTTDRIVYVERFEKLPDDTGSKSVSTNDADNSADDLFGVQFETKLRDYWFRERPTVLEAAEGSAEDRVSNLNGWQLRQRLLASGIEVFDQLARPTFSASKRTTPPRSRREVLQELLNDGATEL